MDASSIEAIAAYLRRKYAANLAGLKSLADQVAPQAMAAEQFTMLSLEGGSAQSTVNVPAATLLLVIERLIAEIDPSYSPPPTQVTRHTYAQYNLST